MHIVYDQLRDDDLFVYDVEIISCKGETKRHRLFLTVSVTFIHAFSILNGHIHFMRFFSAEQKYWSASRDTIDTY